MVGAKCKYKTGAMEYRGMVQMSGGDEERR